MSSISWVAGGNVRAVLEILGLEKGDVTITGDTLTIEDIEQSDLDEAFATYNSDPEKYILTPKRIIAKRRLLNFTYALTLGRYSPARQQLFHAMLTESIIDGRPNRAAYIRQLLDWLKAAAALLITAEDEIDAAQSVADMRAVSVDLEPLKNTDPGITVRAALEIVD